MCRAVRDMVLLTETAGGMRGARERVEFFGIPCFFVQVGNYWSVL